MMYLESSISSFACACPPALPHTHYYRARIPVQPPYDFLYCARASPYTALYCARTAVAHSAHAVVSTARARSGSTQRHSQPGLVQLVRQQRAKCIDLAAPGAWPPPWLPPRGLN
eukprot:2219256-Rhodomonas_salina.1